MDHGDRRLGEIKLGGSVFEVHEKAHAEACGGCKVPGAFGGHVSGAIAEVIVGRDMGEVACAGDGNGSAEAPGNEVGVVDMEVDDGAAAAGVVGVEAPAPGGPGAKALERGAADLAQG